MTKAGIKTLWIALSLLVFSSLLYIGTAGGSALVDDDIDAAHALVAREMLQRHDYVTMYMDGIRYLIRPPLHFWMVAASYAMLGDSEFATRLPLALSMIGLVLLTFAFGFRRIQPGYWVLRQERPVRESSKLGPDRCRSRRGEEIRKENCTQTTFGVQLHETRGWYAD